MKISITTLLNCAKESDLTVNRYEVLQAIKAGELKAVKVKNKYEIEISAALEFLKAKIERKVRFEHTLILAKAFCTRFVLPIVTNIWKEHNDKILNADILEEKED